MRMKSRLPTLVVVAILSPVTLLAQAPCKSTVVGDLHIEHLQSKQYGDTRTLRVWLPPGYDEPANATKKYPVLYLFDGQTAFDDCTSFSGEHELRVDETVTLLIAEHRIDAMIVVGIDSTSRRSYEYPPYTDTVTDPGSPEPIGKQLPAFLSNEVLPYVSAHYRVTADPDQTGIGGTSLGAVAALYVVLNRSDLFRLALIESPTLPVGNGQLLRDTAFLARGPRKVAIGVGTTELSVPGADQFVAHLGLTMEQANEGFYKMPQALAEHLKNAYLNHPEVDLVIEPGANHTSVSWARRLPEAIVFLYGTSKMTK